MAGLSSVSLHPERYSLGLLRFDFKAHYDARGKLRDDELGHPRLEGRLKAFGFFVSQRLGELGAWRKSGAKLNLFLAEHEDERSWEQLERESSWDYVFVRAPHLTGRESDEELVSSVASACEKVVRRLVPGAQLGVLADEFLSAGCECVLRPPMVRARGVTAQLEVRHGMSAFEAMLAVETGAGLTRHRVLAGGAGSLWDSLLGKLSVSAKSVVIRAWPGGLYLADGVRRHVYDTGNAVSARRFVVEVGAGGRQRVTQQWQLTGAGGKPVPRTRLIVKDVASANAYLSKLRWGI